MYLENLNSIKAIEIHYSGNISLYQDGNDRYNKVGLEDGWVVSASNKTGKIILVNMNGHSKSAGMDGRIKLFQYSIYDKFTILKVLVVESPNTLVSNLSIHRIESNLWEREPIKWSDSAISFKNFTNFKKIKSKASSKFLTNFELPKLGKNKKSKRVNKAIYNNIKNKGGY